MDNGTDAEQKRTSFKSESIDEGMLLAPQRLSDYNCLRAMQTLSEKRLKVYLSKSCQSLGTL